MELMYFMKCEDQTLDAYSIMGLTYTVYALRKKSNITTEETTEHYTNTWVSFSNNAINMAIKFQRRVNINS